MENLSLSVPDLLTTVKKFVQPDKHEQLDQMLQRYLCKELGKQQVRSACIENMSYLRSTSGSHDHGGASRF